MKRITNNYGDHFKVNLRLALPIITGQVGQILVNIADNVMVGRLGSTELAAVSLANAIFISFLVVGMGISFALPPLVAESTGKEEHHLISSHVKHSLVINLVYAVVAILGIELIIPFMYSWGQEPNVVTFAIPYLRISAYTMLVFMAFQTFRTYSDGRSETLPPMMAILMGNVLNIGFNYAFIYGKFGAPMLGVKGAALGTMLARFVMLILLLLILWKWKDLWHDIRHMNLRKYQLPAFRKILKLGVPTSLQGLFEVSAFGAAAIMAGMISKEAQAAHQIALNLASISFLICTGLAMTATIRVGQYYGAKDIVQLRKAGFSAIIQVILFMGLTSLIFVLFRSFFPSLYIKEKEVVEIAASLLIIAAIFQIPDGTQVATVGALRGMQDVNVPTLITFVAYWVMALPMSYLLAFKAKLGVNGIWYGLSIGLAISAVFMWLRFNKLSKQILYIN